MSEIQRELNPESIMSFGKYKGQPMKDIPEGYFMYLLLNKLNDGNVKDYINSNYELTKRVWKKQS